MIGQLAAGVAHEINNPLTVVMGQADLLRHEDLAPEHQESVRYISDAADRARMVAERLLLFARRQKADRQLMALSPLVHETVEMMRQHFAVRNVPLIEELEDDLPHVLMHSGQIQQIILNLIGNSKDAILENREEGNIWVRTYQQGEYIVLEVADDGPGIPEDLREKIFEPFVTTKEPGMGTGLGLSVCHGIAQEHDGHLYARPQDAGASIVLRLPTKTA